MNQRSLRGALSGRLPVLLACVAGLAIPVASVTGGEVHYNKRFTVVDIDPATANIWAGGETQTWSEKPAQDAVKVLFDAPTFGNVAITRSYRHYTTNTDFDRLRRTSDDSVWGLPAHMDGPLSGGFFAHCNSEDGYGSHAYAQIDTLVSPEGPATIPVRQRVGNQVQIVQRPIDWTRAADIVLSGNAAIPTNEQYQPSADSFAAAAVCGGKVFRYTGEGDDAVWEATGKQTMIAAAEARRTKMVAYDPWVIRMTDLTLGEMWAEEIWRFDWDALDADFSIDETGITLTIDQTNADAGVGFTFTMPSSWVINPYDYGAQLTPAGFTAWGATPPEGWSITTNGTIVTAFYAFGPEGQPWDLATIMPPESLLIEGHDYSYDAGAGAGVYILGDVPGPSTLVILAGVIAWTGFRHRARES